VDDLVDGIYQLLMLEDYHEPVNLGNPNELSILEFAVRINELTGNTAGLVYHPRPVDDPTRRCPDITRARQLLDWEPKVGLAEGLDRTIRYFKKLVNGNQN
jgi:dTDP-glucose 4,6-dehydratase